MMTDEEFEATRRGTYTEPFTQNQYGVFAVEEDGLRFVGAGVDRISAMITVDNYNRDMKIPSGPVVIRRRTLTFSPWDEGGEEVPDLAIAVTEHWNKR